MTNIEHRRANITDKFW